MSPQDKKTLLSIGAVAQATGIPSETLRTWERRYGFPRPSRTEGGHRVYCLETVEHLKLLSVALDQGHRPGQVVGKPRKEVEPLLDLHMEPGRKPEECTRKEVKEIAGPGEQVELWLEAARSFDGKTFDDTFARAWYMMGPMTFLEEYAARFLQELGDAWEKGTISVAQEHFASERVRTFLATQWHALSDRSQGPRVICTTLPGEQHALGLHMAALVTALAGYQVIFLGANTPIEDIARTCHEVEGGTIVMVSSSRASNKILTSRMLRELRELLPADISLIVGGDGAPFNVESVQAIESLRELKAAFPTR